MKKIGLMFIVLLASVGFLQAAKPDLTQVSKQLDGYMVDVVYTLQYDERGEVPSTLGLYCGACKKLHDDDLSDLLENGHDLVVTGFVVAPDKVLVPDMMIDDEAVKALQVRKNGVSVKAQVVNIYPNEGMQLLQLDQPLSGVKSVELTAWNKKDKLYTYSRIVEYGEWIERVCPFAVGAPQLWNKQRISREMPGCSLVINENCQIIAVLGNNNELLNADRWDLPYTKWQTITLRQFNTWKKELLARLEKSIFPVTVYLNEPRQSNRDRLNNRTFNREIYIAAYKLPSGEICVPLLISPDIASRIKKVVVHTPSGDVEAVFDKVLKDYGCMLLKLKRDVPWQPIAAEDTPMCKHLGGQVWSANVSVFRKQLKIQVESNAIGAMMRGFKQRQYGFVIKRNASKGIFDDLVFTLDGKLLGAQLNYRIFNYNSAVGVLCIGELKKILADPRQTLAFKNQCNPLHVIAFLGVEFQNMTGDLARSLQQELNTRYGRDGLLVSYVYPGSTAEKIGLKNGDILLKLIVPGMGKPMRLDRENFAVRQSQQFPWQQLDRLPEMYYSEIPEPWNELKDPLNNRLTAIGIGQEVELIAICSGKLSRKRFKIEAAPLYFEIAPSYRSPAFGLEVRNMTFEVRRYFRMDKKTPGVIIYNVFAGSGASTAGLKPFEIITAVNDKFVYNVEDFRKAVTGATELRLSVRRLAADRVVTVRPKLGKSR